MKAQFKYAFRAGLYIRGLTFAIISVMNFVFIVLGQMQGLPLAAQITFVSLGGIAIAVMFAVNIISDVKLADQIFKAPGAYLYALTPVPRWKPLLASVITMTVLDLFTMTVLIFSQVWLSLNYAGGEYTIGVIGAEVTGNIREYSFMLWLPVFLVACYLLVLMLALLCETLTKSVFYAKPAAGLLSFLSTLAVFYVFSLIPIVLAPFGELRRWGFLILITLNKPGIVLFVLMVFVGAAALFVVTARLMERKMNL